MLDEADAVEVNEEKEKHKEEGQQKILANGIYTTEMVYTSSSADMYNLHLSHL